MNNEAKNITFAELYPLICDEIGRGNDFSFTAFGSSMFPFIIGGKDRVKLSKLSRPIQKYDMLFYRRKNGSFVLHRVIKLQKNGDFTLCGDNQYNPERDVKQKQVIAILTGLEHKGRRVNIESFHSMLWCFLLPVRRFILHLKASGKAILRKLTDTRQS